MNKWKEFYQYYKQNPIEYYEDYFSTKLTRFQKIKLKICNNLARLLQELIYEQNKIFEEILIEPYGTTRYKILELHLNVLELRVTLIKELFKIK